MIPTWAVFVIVLVIVVGYFLLTASGRQRRKERIAADFAKMPDFHANQVFTDVRGDTAIGIDDRGRRIAVARRHAQPRTTLYSFAHIASAELVQNGAVMASTSKAEQAKAGPAEEGQAKAGQAEGSLFGSTGRAAPGMPVIKPGPGPLTTLAVRVVLQDALDSDLVVRFYEGKAIEVESVAGDKAFGDARACLGALEIAIKRAGLPPGPAVIRATPRL
jgi:hypothetical protein